MNATIHPFPPQGDSPDLPSLEEMYSALIEVESNMDDIDRDFLLIIRRVFYMGDKAKIETIKDCRDIASSMMNRYGVKI